MIRDFKRSKKRTWRDRSDDTDDKKQTSSTSSSTSTTTTKSAGDTRRRTRSAEPAPLETQAHEYLLHEYDAHTRYLSGLYGRLGMNLQLGLLGTVGYWGWVIVWRNPSFVDNASLVASLPYMLAIAFLFQTLYYNREVRRIIEYGTAVERKFNLPPGTGYYKNCRRYGGDLPRALLIFAWLLLVIVNFLAPWQIRRHFTQSQNAALTGQYRIENRDGGT